MKAAAASRIRKQLLEVPRQKPSQFYDEELAEVLPCEWEIRGVEVKKAGYILDRIMIETITADLSFVNCGIHNVQVTPFDWSIRELGDVFEQG